MELTLDVLRQFGIRVEERENGFHVPGNQSYQSREFTVEARMDGTVLGVGTGNTKKAAEQEAAYQTILMLHKKNIK